jgi:hypothetical protein
MSGIKYQVKKKNEQEILIHWRILMIVRSICQDNLAMVNNAYSRSKTGSNFELFPHFIEFKQSSRELKL